MRVVTHAASDVAHQETPPEVFWDALFRDTKGRIVSPPGLDAPVADSHAHLDMLHHPALSLARASAHGVDFIVTIVDPTEDPLYTFQNLAEWKTGAHALLDEWHGNALREHDKKDAPGTSVIHNHAPAIPSHVPDLRVIVGCHPHNASKYTVQVERIIIKAAGQPITGAIGEIGLDYHYDLSPRLVQQEVFKRQLELANEMLLPVVLHLREAHEDGLRILQEQGMPLAGTLLHCFNLDFATLKPFLDLGCFVAFGGALTFKKADEVRDAARQAPLSRIMTETDAPFMAPHPVRGVICGPEHTVFTAAALVEAHGVQGREAIQLLTQVYENTRRFFDRDTSSWQDNPKAQEVLYAHAKGVRSNG